jgi:branched-chain amino acid transport system ATP-binding protein
MAPLLEVDRLQKRYGAIVVADDVSFSLNAATCLGVIGPNGAGKSSLFGLIAGSVVADGGAIRLEGRDITRLAAHQRTRFGIARAFQIPQPFSQLSVYENVLAATTFSDAAVNGDVDDWVADVLKRTGLLAKWATAAGRLTLLDRKRLELAKAIAARAKVMLLDEIAGGLTDREVGQITELIQSLKAEHAIIWIEHIPHALRAVADEILVLNFGKNVLMGTPAEVTASRVMREIYMGIADDEVARN